MAKKYNFIYITTNQITGKQYVGSHNGCKNDLYIGSGKVLLKSIRRYGKENFKRKILKICKPTENLKLEEKYIDEYNTLIPNGYNISPSGGHGLRGKLNEETKRKLSKSKIGNLNPAKRLDVKEKISKTLKGRKIGPLSEETKKKLSEGRKGEKNWMYGKNASKETRRKMSNSHKGRIKSKEECKNISLSKIGNKNPAYKRKYMYDPKSKEIKFIKKEEINDYLKKGWEYRHPAKNKIWITNRELKTSKLINKEQLNNFIENGWKKGRKI